ncbi:MAG: DUF4347 domain-containing protein [Cyanobacteria bacterium P01_F01_bin.143]
MQKNTHLAKPLVILDHKISQLGIVIDDLKSRANLVVLNSQQNGIAQITQALKKYQNFSSLHLISHGSPGCLYLGNEQLNIENLNENKEQLKLWQQFLTGKDFLVYGCQVAKEKGVNFLKQLSQLTGSNIAASEETIGLSDSGRYWNLEFRLGTKISSDVIVSTALQASYNGVFIAVGDTSDFEDGTTQGWRIGNPADHPNPPINISDGGPDGVGDNFLQTQSIGGAGVGSRLVWFNQSSSWTGNYTEAGVTAISASVINQGVNDVVLRVAFDGSGGRFVTTEGITVSPGDDWQEITLNITADDLTASGGSDVDATLSNVTTTRFLSNPNPSYTGAPVVAQVGVDNITAIGETTTEDLPIVSLSATPQVSEDGDDRTFSVTFNVEGEIPEGGLPVVIGGDAPILFDPELNLLDQSVPLSFDPADGLIPLENRGTEFVVGITAPTVSVSVALFDDIIEEEPLEINFALLESEDYIVDGDGIATTVVVDGDSVIPGSGPTVSLSVSDTELFEGDELTVNFDVDGDIPEGGLQVFIAAGPTDLGEFNIFNEDGSPAIALEGIDEFPLQGGDEGGFFVTLAENQASITLSVFEDGPTEGSESLTFELINGEQYEVNSDASTVILNVDDGGEDASFAVESGVTSVFLDFPLLEEAAGLTLVGVDSDATPSDRPAFLDPFQVGFAITEETDFSFAPVPFTPLGGTIEHSGTITLALGGAEVTVGEFSIGFDGSRVSETASGFFVADTLEDALGLEILFDVGAPGTVNISGGDLEISDADLLLAPELANALGLPDLAGADVGDAQIDAVYGTLSEELNILDTPFIRFQNSGVPGTYVFATGDEADSIRANEPGFVEEGVAFSAAIAPNDDLIALTRLESNQLPGTFLYVGDEELASINADPNFSNAFTDQGVAFYVYGAGAGEETPFNRFQNSDVPGTYLYATGAEADSIRANFPNFIDEGVAFEALI